ncbi:Crp/Fnr family transcriptional regulator [Larkinella sp. VNQ87]|uniref:Crp/Fnr family transcriptional regulator n=1 Tax=Larkinella sp. VNQ87 TaxID=3400921 RepID=UPI003BFF4E66
MDELATLIRSQISVSEPDLTLILSHFKEHRVAKDRFLLQRGQIVTSYYFIQSGGLRIYFDKDDQQITVWLAFANEFFTELGSLKTGKPSPFTIQALEDTTLFLISSQDMDALYRQLPAWQQFGRQVWENAFLNLIEAVISHQTLSAEERYRQLMQQSDLLQKIPLKQLSTYLGITPTSLSRIRKNIR